MNLQNQTFGSWLVIERGEGRRHWVCRCGKCGELKTVRQDHLLNGMSKSCGCENHNKTHAQSLTTEYSIWANMKQRCFNSNNDRFKDYGGAGVTICERWLVFDNFLTDMGKRPTGKSLDRINPFGNYEPENCRWATPKEQQLNRRATRYLTYKGQTLPLALVAEQHGIRSNVLRARLELGWPLELALTLPVSKPKGRCKDVPST